MSITGGCQCGAIRYELSGPPDRVVDLPVAGIAR